MDVSRTQRIQALPDRVFAALVEPELLTQWFCDMAHVEPREGGTYAFGGPHAYGGEARGRIVRLERPRALAYTWPLAGGDTLVSMNLEQAESATDLVVSHTDVASLPLDSDYPTEYLQATWIVLLRQLAAFLAGRPLPRYDFTTLPGPTVDLQIEIAAPVERVWEKLTVPAEMNRWISKDAKVELRIGGRYSYGWQAEEAREDGPQYITALEPPHLLAFSWAYHEALGTVTWTLDPIPGGTRVRLVHEGLVARPGLRRDYHIGWWDFLVALKDLEETAAG